MLAARANTDDKAPAVSAADIAEFTQTRIDLPIHELTGNSHRISIQLSDTVRALKQKIYTDGHAGIEPDCQQLVLNNKWILDDEELSLGVCGVRRDSELVLLPQVSDTAFGKISVFVFLFDFIS
eukprot:COSAG02_NODE_3632_length_6449_cov_2.797795_3_plen_124_part_00